VYEGENVDELGIPQIVLEEVACTQMGLVVAPASR
jgi:hypothetical protein